MTPSAIAATATTAALAAFHFETDALDGRLGAPHAMEVAYEPQHRSTMIFNTTSGVLEDPDGKERNAWEGFTAGIQPQANTRSS